MPRVPSPSWIVFGINDNQGGVWVYASRELSGVRLDMQFESDIGWGYDYDMPLRRYVRSWVELTARMGQYVVVRGSSYGDAFNHLHDLFEQWAEKPAAPAQIKPILRELEP